MRPILVPTDFSTCAYNALQYAVAIAKETKAKISLLHVYGVPLPPPIAPVILIDEQELKAGFMKQLKELVDFELKLHDDADLEIEYDAREGFTPREVIDAARQHKAGMIVMGTQGASGLKKIFMGSNTADVILKSTCPVMAIPEKAKYFGFKKIVFAADMHEIKNNSTFDALVETALLFNSELLILSVHKKENEIFSIKQDFERLNLNDVFKRIPHHFHHVIADEISEGIDNFVKTENADLLVTVPQKHSYFDLLFNKSTTRNLVFHADTPVLSLPELD